MKCPHGCPWQHQKTHWHYKKMSQPTPGSNEAIECGCRCAVIDNHYGQGFGDPPQFWISADCPIHANWGNKTRGWCEDCIAFYQNFAKKHDKILEEVLAQSESCGGGCRCVGKCDIVDGCSKHSPNS